MRLLSCSLPDEFEQEAWVRVQERCPYLHIVFREHRAAPLLKGPPSEERAVIFVTNVQVTKRVGYRQRRCAERRGDSNRFFEVTEPPLSSSIHRIESNPVPHLTKTHPKETHKN